MFTITSRQDVLNVAKTFGVAALKHITDNSTMNMDACQRIHETMFWASSEVINIESVNDGNVVYEIDAVFNAVKIAGIYNTGIDDIKFIRSGFGSFELSLREVMERKELTLEQVQKVLAEVSARNSAAEILYP